MNIDLNLLRVFDILMEVRSVSRAATRLGLTQSAVSHALARLRDQLGDPLFIRSRNGLRPTARATDIAPSIREGLWRLRDALASPGFDPATSTRGFTISASSYVCATMLPTIIERARAEAPLARFRITAPGADLLSGLDAGTLDLALGTFGSFAGRFTKSVLFMEHLVWVGRAGSGAENLASRPRLSLARTPQPASADEPFQPDGLDQRLGIEPGASFPSGPSPVTLHDPLSAGALIACSDLVTLLPKQLAAMITGRGRIDILGPSGHGDIEMSMLWHSRSTADPAHVWLRGLVAAAVPR